MSKSLESVFAALDCREETARQRITAFLSSAGLLEGNNVQTVSAEPPKPQLVMLDPSVIQVDAPTYQFRSGGDKQGVLGEKRYHTDHWDPILHGDPLMVHQRLDGSYYVADGHHRLDLAKRLNAEGHGPGPVAALILRESEGYTAQDARIIAAYKNIQRGTTNPVDNARVFKEASSPNVHQEWLPHLQMDKGNLKMSFSLAKLSDNALDMVAQGEVPAETAAYVAEHARDSRQQDSVMRIISDTLHQDHFDQTGITLPDAKQAAVGFASRIQQERSAKPTGYSLH